MIDVLLEDARERMGKSLESAQHEFATHGIKTAEVSVEADTYQVTVEPGITITAPRTTSRDIRRHKASNYA